MILACWMDGLLLCGHEVLAVFAALPVAGLLVRRVLAWKRRV